MITNDRTIIIILNFKLLQWRHQEWNILSLMHCNIKTMIIYSNLLFQILRIARSYRIIGPQYVWRVQHSCTLHTYCEVLCTVYTVSTVSSLTAQLSASIPSLWCLLHCSNVYFFKNYTAYLLSITVFLPFVWGKLNTSH